MSTVCRHVCDITPVPGVRLHLKHGEESKPRSPGVMGAEQALSLFIVATTRETGHQNKYYNKPERNNNTTLNFIIEPPRRKTNNVVSEQV